MGKKLFVGGLSFNTTDDGMRTAFAEAGTVETAQVVVDRMSGRSRGFGFVEMATEEEAAAAIQMWNGRDLDGRTLRVSEAQPKRSDDRRGGGGGGGGYRN